MNLRKKTLLYSKKWKVFFLKNKITKERLSGQSSSFTSQYEADEKSNAELFFKENLTKSSTPIDRRTRSNIAATEVDAKVNGAAFQGLKSRYRMTLIQMRNKTSNLKKKINSLLNKLRLNEQSILFAEGDGNNNKKLEKYFEK